MSQPGKLDTIAPSVRSAAVVTPSGASTGAASTATGFGIAPKPDGVAPHVSSDRPAPLESSEPIRIDVKKSTTAGVGFFTLQNLLSLLPGWSVSFAGHAVLLVLLTVIATSPLKNKSALRLDGFLVDATEFADEAEYEREFVEETELLNVDVAALNSEASRETTDIVRDEGFKVSLLEGLGEGIGMEAMANSGLTPLEVADEGGVQSKNDGSSTQFFGTQATGNRFVFIIDASGSMSEGFLWSRAIRELVKSIGKLSEKQKAVVLLYNSHTFPMFNTPPEKLDMVPVTKDFKRALVRWLRNQIPNGRTMPAHALSYGLSLEPDAIFLLSDGKLNDNSFQVLASENPAKDPESGDLSKVPVHTISLGPNQLGIQLMKQIADTNNGEFRWVK